MEATPRNPAALANTDSSGLAIGTIRRPTRDELPAVAAVVTAALGTYRGAVSAAVLDRYIEDARTIGSHPGSADLLVLEHDRRLVGTVIYDRRAQDLDPSWASIRTLMVDPRERGRGFGRMLVEHCMRRAARDGVAGIGLHTAAFMTTAVALYEQLGFVRCRCFDLRASRLLGLEPGPGDLTVIAYRRDIRPPSDRSRRAVVLTGLVTGMHRIGAGLGIEVGLGLGLGTGLGTGIGACSILTGHREAKAMASRGNTLPPVTGSILFEQDARTAAADDFGHLVHREPQAVVLPASDDDIVAVIRWAAANGRKVAARGQGHSVFGRAQAADGVVIDMAPLRSVHAIDRDRVVVEAGAKWSEVLAATLPRGLAPPVLTDYLELSVGGTLVVGGIGGRTSDDGAQTDNVLAIEVVTGDGRKLRCSPDDNAALFDAVRAGLGQVAVVTRATVTLVPAPDQVRRILLTYRDLKTMLDDARLLTGDGRFDVVQGAIVARPDGGWTFRLDVAKALPGAPDTPDDRRLLAGLSDQRSEARPVTMPYLDYLGRLATLEKALRANGHWHHPHPWLTTFVGDDAVEDVVADELSRLTPAELGPMGQVVLSPLRRSSIRTPLLRLPDGDLCHAFNLVRLPATGSTAVGERLTNANRAIYDRIRGRGGTLYPVSAFAMSGDDWRRHFGPAFAALDDARRRYDPKGLLTPGYELFERRA
ncbi:MAG: GNAT family N-acetyltransferase [Burkholderiaceae bacterium]